MNTSDHASEPVVPPPDVLAFFIRFQREMMRWKQATLASKAEVSLSTIQRVERGDKVSPDALEKIGNALGHPRGAFTAPRVRGSEEEALQRAVESFSWLTDTVPVKVAPLRKEPQLREVLGCASAFVDSDLGPDADEDLAKLKEWLDFASWIVATSEGLIAPHPGRSFKKRELYSDIFAHVGKMERKHRAVCLVGSYEATSDVEMFATLQVGVIAFKSKARNPAAAMIPELRAVRHERMAELLVHTQLSITDAARCVVWNEDSKSAVEAIVKASGAAFPPIEFQAPPRYHWFLDFQNNRQTSLVIGPKEIAQIFEITVSAVTSSASPGSTAKFSTLRDLLDALDANFGATPQTTELIGLKSENGIHRKTVDLHTLDVVNGLQAVPGYHALEPKYQRVVRLAAYLARSTEDIAEVWLAAGVPLVLILPFGIATRKSASAYISSAGRNLCAVSLLGPRTKWSREALGKSMAFLRSGASALLVSDPEPDWIAPRFLNAWPSQRANVRYDGTSSGGQMALLKSGFTPVARSSETGNPNIDSLIGDHLNREAVISAEPADGTAPLPAKLEARSRISLKLVGMPEDRLDELIRMLDGFGAEVTEISVD